MTPRGAFWKWGTLGIVVSSLLLFAQMQAVDGPEGLLQVGETSALRPLIEAELGEVPLAAGPGHDGQIYYAVGIDLLGEQVPDLLDSGPYRYRRILFPLLASGFGLFDGQALLAGMIGLTIVSTAVAAGSVAAMARRWGGSDWFALAVLLNPGVWLSVRLLTADILALALMTVGLYLLTASRPSAVLAFTLSGLGKDIYLTTPLGVAMDEPEKRWSIVAIPGAVLVAWMVWLTMWMGQGFTGRGNLAWPFVGIVEGADTWPTFGAAEWLYMVFALASVLAGLVYSIVRTGWLRWSIFGWSLLGVISSNWVWDLGNNAARAFAPIAVLIAIAVSQATAGDRARTSDRTSVAS